MRIFALLCLATVAQAAPPACTTQFQYACSSTTLGGYTVITPLAATGETQIQGFNTSNAVVFNTTIPIPPAGAAATDTPTQQAVLQADALLAISLGYAQADTLPACSVAGPPCLAPNPGGQTVNTSSTTRSYVPQDTVVSQEVNRYATTLQATVNGQTAFQQTYAAAFSDPALQEAVSAADAILMADHASPAAPVQTSNSSALQGSQTSYMLTGDTTPTGSTAMTSTKTFGPNVIAIGSNQTEVFFILAGEVNNNVNTSTEYYAARNVVTTDTNLTTQTYTIQGTGGTPYSACDINRDAAVNVLDVQAILTQASGASLPGASDLNGDGAVDVVDIQFVIDATLNLGCAAVNTGTSSVTATAVRSLPATAVDSAGNRYLVDRVANRIRKLAADGTESTVVVPGIDRPVGVAVDPAGNLYVTDSGHRVFKLFAGTLTTVEKRR